MYNLVTRNGNDISVRAFRIVEEENNLDEWEVFEVFIKNKMIQFDFLNDCNKEMIYNNLERC